MAYRGCLVLASILLIQTNRNEPQRNETNRIETKRHKQPWTTHTSYVRTNRHCRKDVAVLWKHTSTCSHRATYSLTVITATHCSSTAVVTTIERVQAADICSANHLFGQLFIRPTICSANHVVGKSLARPVVCSANHLFGQSISQPISYSVNHLFGQSKRATDSVYSRAVMLWLKHTTALQCYYTNIE